MEVSVFTYVIGIFQTMTNIGISNLFYKLIEKEIWLLPESSLLKIKIVIKLIEHFQVTLITLEIKFTRYLLFFCLIHIEFSS